MQQENVPPGVRGEAVDWRTLVQYSSGDGASLDPPFRRLPLGAAFGPSGLTPDEAAPMLTTLQRDTAKVRCRMPLFIHKRILLRHPRSGELFYLEWLWASSRRWERRSDSLSPDWHPRSFGPFVLAWRVLF